MLPLQTEKSRGSERLFRDFCRNRKSFKKYGGQVYNLI